MDIGEEITHYYDQGAEATRLSSGRGRLEFLRTSELLARALPEPPAVVLDVGGGPGTYALDLAGQGYTVDLIDPVARHVKEAGRASDASTSPLRAAVQADARDLPYAGASADVVLLLGPLYHLPEPADRATALAQARRVLRPGGVLVVAGISRWAGLSDAFARASFTSDSLTDVVTGATRTGAHHNPERTPGWFTSAYFHRPADLVLEVAAAGFDADGPIAVEGPAGSASDEALEELLDGGAAQDRTLAALREVEREPALMGASPHVVVIGRPRSPEPAPAQPPSVPEGMHLELSRARVLPGQEKQFERWMQMLHERYAQCQDALPAERAALEATFSHTEDDGTTWMYHLGLIGTDSAGLDTSTEVGAAHLEFAMAVKERGWTELAPRFLLGPQPVLDALAHFARTGQA